MSYCLFNRVLVEGAGSPWGHPLGAPLASSSSPSPHVISLISVGTEPGRDTPTLPSCPPSSPVFPSSRQLQSPGGLLSICLGLSKSPCPQPPSPVPDTYTELSWGSEAGPLFPAESPPGPLLSKSGGSQRDDCHFEATYSRIEKMCMRLSMQHPLFRCQQLL